MIRVLLFIAFLVAVYYVMKTVLRAAVRGYHDGEEQRRTRLKGEEMVLDPECRTYVLKERAVTRRIDFMDALYGLRTRVLYLYGTDSKYRAVADMNVGRFARYARNIEVVSFAGGVHDLHLQYPDEVTAVVLQFLAKTPAKDIVAGAAAAPRVHAGVSGKIVD